MAVKAKAVKARSEARFGHQKEENTSYQEARFGLVKEVGVTIRNGTQATLGITTSGTPVAADTIPSAGMRCILWLMNQE